MALFSVVTNFQSTLVQGMTSSQSSMVLSSVTVQGHTLAPADYGSILYITINPGASNMEVVRASTNSGTTFTLDKRGLLWYGDNDTESSTYKFAHNAGEPVIISNVKNIYDKFVDIFSDETISGVKTFVSYPKIQTYSVPTADEQFAPKKYIDDIAIAGSPDASTTTKGISKLSTAPASATDPIAVGTNDTRVPTQGENDALVGNNTDIAVGTGNKFVTQTGLQKSAECYAVDAAGNDTYVVTLSPVPTGYAAGMTLRVKFATANTGAATLNVNTLGAISITKNGGSALEDNDIKAGQTLTVVYDATGPKFEIQSLSVMSQANATTLNGGTSSNADALHTHDFNNFAVLEKTEDATYAFFPIQLQFSQTLTAEDDNKIDISSTFFTLSSGSTASTGAVSATYAAGGPAVTAGSIYSDANLGSQGTYSYKMETNGSSDCNAWVGFDQGSANTAIPTTAVHFGIIKTGAVIYASNANGTTQTTTNITASFTESQFNTIKIVRGASSIEFYVNETLVATHTTNLPASGGLHYRARVLDTATGGETLKASTMILAKVVR